MTLFRGINVVSISVTDLDRARAFYGETLGLGTPLYDLPEAIVEQAQTTCEQIRARVEAGDEPFASVGFAWLADFLAEYDPTVEFGSRKER